MEPKEADEAPRTESFVIRCIAPDVAALPLRVRPGLTGGELRARVAAQLCDVLPSRLRLICAGRLLTDGETLAAAGVAEGHVVHVAVRPADAPPAPPPAEPEPVGAEAEDDLPALQLALQTELRLLAEQHGREARGRGLRWERGRGREGDAADFAWGLVSGLLLGVLGFLCVLEPAAPRALKAGLFLGVLLNVSGSMARVGGDSRAARDDVSDW